MNLTIAACQILTYPDVRKSTEKILSWMDQAAQSQADVIVFPEACLCGYPAEPEYWKHADPVEFSACETDIIEASHRLDMAVVLGTAHWEDDVLYNSLLIVDKGGTLRGRYAKTHLAEEWPSPGRKLPLYTLAGVVSCFIICHDIRYPALVRLPAIAGAQICYFCSNESGLFYEGKLSAYRAMPISRACENGIYLVMANAPADPADVKSKSQSHGNSKIIHPDGNVLDEAGYFEERLIVCTVETDDADRWVAKRSVDDKTILAGWLRNGAELVGP